MVETATSEFILAQSLETKIKVLQRENECTNITRYKNKPKQLMLTRRGFIQLKKGERLPECYHLVKINDMSAGFYRV